MLFIGTGILATRHSDGYTFDTHSHTQKGNHILLPAVQLTLKHWPRGTLWTDLLKYAWQ